jgi:hypothetical protein
MGPILEALGGIVSNLAGAFTILLAAFSPFLTKWLKYVEKLTEGWLETIKVKEATGELEAIFATAAAVMESLWTSLGNFLGGIGNTVKATFSEGGGGWYFLTWLETVTEKWEQFTKRGAEDGSLDKYILGLSVSFTLLLESLGLILKGFLDIAASEGFANFMTKVNESIKIFNEIGLDIANSALPAVGDFILAFAKLTKLFFDAESIAIFFKTLAVILNGIVTLLDNDVAKAIISGIGALVAFGLAIGLLQNIFGFFGKVLLGAMANMVRLFSVIMPSGSAAAATLRAAMTALATGNIAAAAPILIVVAAIVALVAIFKLAWDNSEKFRNAVKELAAAVGGALKDGMEQIKKALGDVGASTENLREFFKKLGDFLGTYIVPFFKEVFVLAIGVVVDVIVGLIKVVKGIWDAFTSGDPTKAIKAIFDAVFGLVKSITERIAKAFGFKLSWAWLTDGLEGAINFIARGINKVSEILNKAINGFNKINPFKDVPTIPPIGVPIKLAKGGIIPATSGGVLATIGEAGRPERVEPLDPDGLSKRDRAMIAMLAGPAGGINITVNPSPGMDERELAALVSRQLAFQLRKGAA